MTDQKPANSEQHPQVRVDCGVRLRKVDVAPDLVRITLLPLLQVLGADEPVNSNMRIQEWVIHKDCFAAIEAEVRRAAEKQVYENIVSKVRLQFGKDRFITPFVDYLEYLKSKLD